VTMKGTIKFVTVLKKCNYCYN